MIIRIPSSNSPRVSGFCCLLSLVELGTISNHSLASSFPHPLNFLTHAPTHFYINYIFTKLTSQNSLNPNSRFHYHPAFFPILFSLPCLLSFSCLRDTFIPESKMLSDPRRLYAPGRLYHLVYTKVWRCVMVGFVIKDVIMSSVKCYVVSDESIKECCDSLWLASKYILYVRFFESDVSFVNTDLMIFE